jgi:hypothetical protein
MGNFYFNGYHRETGAYAADNPWNYGYMTELFFEKGKPVTYRLIPYHLEDGGELLHVYEGEDKETMLAYIDKLSAILADRKESQRLYDAWCAVSGIGHLKYMPKWEDAFLSDPERGKTVALLRNLHTCEAHCAMITRAAHLLYLGRIEKALADYEDLQALRKMPL